MIIYVLICQWNISGEEGCNVEGVYSSLEIAKKVMYERIETDIAEEVINIKDYIKEESDTTIYYHKYNNEYLYYWIQEKTLDQ